MKTYVIKSYTNYNLVTQIVNADSMEEALIIAKENGAWDDCEIEEVDLELKGLVYTQF